MKKRSTTLIGYALWAALGLHSALAEKYDFSSDAGYGVYRLEKFPGLRRTAFWRYFPLRFPLLSAAPISAGDWVPDFSGRGWRTR